MKLNSFCVALLAILAFDTISFANGDAKEQCKQLMSSLLVEQMTTIVPCIKGLGYKTGRERADHFYCIMKCMLVEAGTLAKDGSVSVQQAIKFILEKIPVDIMEVAIFEISKCQKHASALALDASDTTCQGLQPLIGCSINVIMNLCKKM